MRKFISLLSSAALAATMLVPMAASAAEGDVLLEQDFDDATINADVTYQTAADGITVPWGGASRGKIVTGYVSVDDTVAADTETVPESVTGNAMSVATQSGQNVSVKYDIKPDLSAPADVYNVTFDIYLRNGAHDLAASGTLPTDSETLALYKYKIGIGSSTVDKNGNATATDMFEFHVIGNAVNIVSGGSDIDTGIVTGDNGVWVKVDMDFDTTQKKMTGTITPEGGDAYFIAARDFASTSASTISQLFVSAERYDGSHKGRVNSYIDNFVVTETVATSYAPITINFVDGSGNTIKDSVTDMALVGSSYTVPETYTAQINDDASYAYYTYVSGADETIESVTEDGAEITLVFEEHAYAYYSVTAVSGDTTLALITEGDAPGGTTVSYAAKYAYVVDGKYYVPAEDAVLSGTIDIEAGGNDFIETTIEYVEMEDAAGAVWDFEDGVDPLTYKNTHLSGAIADGILTVTADNTAGSSTTGDNQWGRGKLSLNAYADYDTVVLSFDSKIAGTGRMIASLLSTEDESSYNDAGLFTIGTKDSGGYRVQGTQNSAGADVWTTSSLKADVANSKLYYEVINRETGAPIASGSSTMTDPAKALVFLSWSGGSTADIDNIEITAYGKEEVEYAEGSYIDLLPDGAVKISDMSDVEGEATVVANHSDAKPAVAGSVSTYETKNKNKSICTAFDVYVAAGDTITVTMTGDDGKATGGAFTLTGSVDGSVGVTYTSNDKGDTGSASSAMVCGTWYRVLLETPQTDGDDSTSTGVSTLTISKINAADCSQTTDVAASCSIAARNIATRGCTAIAIEVSGTPYIDNGVVYKASASGEETETWTKYTVTYKASGEMDTASLETVTDPTTVTDALNTPVTNDDGTTTKVLLWNSSQTAYAATAE